MTANLGCPVDVCIHEMLALLSSSWLYSVAVEVKPLMMVVAVVMMFSQATQTSVRRLRVRTAVHASTASSPTSAAARLGLKATPAS